MTPQRELEHYVSTQACATHCPYCSLQCGMTLQPSPQNRTGPRRKTTHMIKIRLAGAAAASVFGLVALAGTALTVAAPANAAPSNQHTAGSTSTYARQAQPRIPVTALPQTI